MKNKTRLTGPQLAVEYNKLLKENKELKKENAEFFDQITKMHKDLKQSTDIWRERQANWKKDFDNEVSQRKYWEDVANDLKLVLEEKQEIIKIQSMNNRVLLEEIMREREGKK